MIRLAWRQMRLPVVSTAVLFAAVAVVLVWNRNAMTSYENHIGLGSCLSGDGVCPDLLSQFEDRYGVWTTVVTALGFVPLLVGMFWGAPLIAREVEHGTQRLVWSQSIGRWRWFGVRVGLFVLGGLAVGGLLAWLLTWWYGVFARVDPDQYSAIQPPVFETRGIVVPATMLYTFALGTAAGALIRRTVPAMAVALGGYVAERVLFELYRGHLLPPKTYTAPGLGAGSRAGLGDWVLGREFLDGSGNPVSPQEMFQACPKRGGVDSDELMACARSHGFHSIYLYQPLNRFWPLQFMESGILVAAAVVLLAVAAWWTLRRIS